MIPKLREGLADFLDFSSQISPEIYSEPKAGCVSSDGIPHGGGGFQISGYIMQRSLKSKPPKRWGGPELTDTAQPVRLWIIQQRRQLSEELLSWQSRYGSILNHNEIAHVFVNLS